MSQVTYEEALDYFHKTDLEGNSLFGHMTTIVSQLLADKPADPRKAFEHYSSQVRTKKPLSALDPRLPKPSDPSEAEGQYEDAANEALSKATKLLTKQEKPKGEDEENEETNTADVEMPNFLEEFNYHRMIGVGLTQNDSLRLFLTIKELVAAHQLTNVRFFGRITGFHNDYYIVESDIKADEGEDGEKDEKDEDGGEKEGDEGEGDGEGEAAPKRPKPKKPVAVPTEKQAGPNKYTYWVTTDIFGKPWVKLPEVTPAQIAVSRKIRKGFTGNLEKPVQSYPPFPGNEAAYLRAQVSRIVHSTTVSPKGFYHFGEDADEETLATGDPEVNAEFEEPDASELTKLSSWVHHRRFILPQGRVAYWSAPKENAEGDEEDGDEEKEDPNKETGPAILTALSEDKLPLGMSAWRFKSPTGGLLRTKHIPVFLASNVWPGSFTYGLGKKFGTVYYGAGLRYQAGAFTPQPLPPIQTESRAENEASDPTVKEEAEYEEQKRKKQEAEEAGDEDE